MEQRPGAVHYCTAQVDVVHGDPEEKDGFVGIAIKQIPAPAGTGLPTIGTPDIVNTVKAGEAHVIRLKGLVYCSVVKSETGNFVVGDKVYIIPSNKGDATANKLTLATTTGNLKFGRVEAVAGSRGVGTGKCRINLDAKDGW